MEVPVRTQAGSMDVDAERRAGGCWRPLFSVVNEIDKGQSLLSLG